MMDFKPNYFIALRLTEPAYQNAVTRLQSELTSRNPLLTDLIAPVAKLHFTFNVMEINDERIDEAKQFFLEYQDVWARKVDELTSNRISYAGLGTFPLNESLPTTVLWAKPAPGPQLDAIIDMAAILQDGLKSRGFRSSMTNPVHSTVAIASKNSPDVFIQPSDYEGLENLLTGGHVFAEISRLELLAMGTSDPLTNYYTVVASLTSTRTCWITE